ncbi:MAG TPA: zinc-dependent metalloprotease [Candidatus Acidoferrales bacterium]|nr:zinc-dependent metalloprotease [Candidatus Acidoferrales bacterium]
MRNRSRGPWPALTLAVLVGLALVGDAFGQHPAPPTKAQAAAPQSEAKPEEAKKPEGPKPSEEKPFEEVVKDMEVKKGLFTFYYKAEENKLLMELLPDQLDKIFLFSGTLERGTGERGLYAAQMGDNFPFLFHRVGKSIQWIEKNSSFTAQPGTPASRYVARSFADAILGSAKIQAKPHPERKSVLIDVAEMFISDLPGFTPFLSRAYEPTTYRFDKNNSSVGTLKDLPENALLNLTLHYVTENPRTTSVALADPRSIPIGVIYEFSTLKETGYKPRLGDDRVGQFLTVQQDFTSDHPVSPYNRYIHRWQLEKADPTAQLSPPKEPIVFWLENTVPVEYREWFKEGILLWNKAFERVGIKDAIVVKQQPDDADWDPADKRYNTIRWFAGVDATFAIGPSHANPFTGQIYDADIGFSEGLVRYTRRDAEEFVNPVVPAGFEEALRLTRWGRTQPWQCEYVNGLTEQGALALSLLDARGMLTPDVEQKLMREFIIEVTAHEVGHTLGLRHNFRASTILKVDDLNNVQKTEEMGQTSSVMDYNPVVIASKGEKQGHFLTPTLGPYDYWAIEYAYKPIEGDEKAELAKIASRAADPMLPYATDEDARGTFSPLAIDPLANQYDQSSDPIAYYRQRLGIVNELWTSMESKLVKPGEGYQVLRRSFNRGANEYNRALLTSSKFIGGIYHVRDHAGDPNGRPPYTPVPASKQREALEFLRTYAFSEKAFQLPPGLLNKLAIERQEGLDFISYFNVQRLDYAWHDAVLNLQRNVLNRLYHPVLLARVEDNELRFGPQEKPFTMADLFKGLDTAIWSELDTNPAKIPTLRRNLQREHLKQLIRLTLRPAPPQPGPPPVGLVIHTPPVPRPPEDATTLARANLVSLQAKIRAALAGGKVTDPTTKAHLEETQARITATLGAQLQKPLE